MYQISNPVANWWGEGDEKIYIDNENFPSTFGTGTEDYYGYAYCWYEPFTHAYHNQVRVDGPANFGHSCVSRFHFLDALTFDKSIKFDMNFGIMSAQPFRWLQLFIGMNDRVRGIIFL